MAILKKSMCLNCFDEPIQMLYRIEGEPLFSFIDGASLVSFHGYKLNRIAVKVKEETGVEVIVDREWNETTDSSYPTLGSRYCFASGKYFSSLPDEPIAKERQRELDRQKKAVDEATKRFSEYLEKVEKNENTSK